MEKFKAVRNADGTWTATVDGVEIVVEDTIELAHLIEDLGI